MIIPLKLLEPDSNHCIYLCLLHCPSVHNHFSHQFHSFLPSFYCPFTYSFQAFFQSLHISLSICSYLFTELFQIIYLYVPISFLFCSFPFTSLPVSLLSGTFTLYVPIYFLWSLHLLSISIHFLSVPFPYSSVSIHVLCSYHFTYLF